MCQQTARLAVGDEVLRRHNLRLAKAVNIPDCSNASWGRTVQYMFCICKFTLLLVSCSKMKCRLGPTYLTNSHHQQGLAIDYLIQVVARSLQVYQCFNG